MQQLTMSLPLQTVHQTSRRAMNRLAAARILSSHLLTRRRIAVSNAAQCRSHRNLHTSSACHLAAAAASSPPQVAAALEAKPGTILEHRTNLSTAQRDADRIPADAPPIPQPACSGTNTMSAAERSVRGWQQSPHHGNTMADTNIGLAFSLVKHMHIESTKQYQLELARHNGDVSKCAPPKNCVVSPLAIGMAYEQCDKRSPLRRAMHNTLQQYEPRISEYLDGRQHHKLYERLHLHSDEMARLELKHSVALNSGSASHSHTKQSMQQQSHTTSELEFSGYLAPRFSLPQLNFPPYWFPSSGEKYVSLALLRSGRMHYTESQWAQLVDLPYINPAFTVSLIVPRSFADGTIKYHPGMEGYGEEIRQATSLDEYVHRHMSPMGFLTKSTSFDLLQGHLVLPAIDAVCEQSMSQLFGCDDSSLEGRHVHRARLSLSAKGLSSRHKSLRLTRNEGLHRGTMPPQFFLSAHRPFVYMIRHRASNTICTIGTIQSVPRASYEAKFRHQAEMTIETNRVNRVQQQELWREERKELDALKAQLQAAGKQ